MYNLCGHQIRRDLIEKKFSCKEVAEYFIKRAKSTNKKTGAFLHFTEQLALTQSKLIDEKIQKNLPLPPLAGIPISIKDNISISSYPLTCASKFLIDHIAPFSACCIKFLTEAGALIIGKTNLDEFAMGSSTEFSAFHSTKNPWDLSCSPGGSSGGSAASISSRACLLSLGSDTGGSIRQPASFNGILGLKPSSSKISRYGLVALAGSLDQVGPFASCTQDLALLYDAIAKPSKKDLLTLTSNHKPSYPFLKNSLKGKKIAVPWSFFESLNQDVKDNFSKTLDHLKELGCEINNIELHELTHSIAIYNVITPIEAFFNLAKFNGLLYGRRSKEGENLEGLYSCSRGAGFGIEVKQRLILGSHLLRSKKGKDYIEMAHLLRKTLECKFHQIFQEFDLIATPTSPGSAFKLKEICEPNERYLQDLFTISANLTQSAAISIPSGFCKKGLPLGFQLIGNSSSEPLLLSFAFALEKITNSDKFIPKLFDREIYDE
jgi:aspartyl-tRNA(Asn)/glutamyl-tRNA(Gln) amidotransferase subunit A